MTLPRLTLLRIRRPPEYTCTVFPLPQATMPLAAYLQPCCTCAAAGTVSSSSATIAINDFILVLLLSAFSSVRLVQHRRRGLRRVSRSASRSKTTAHSANVAHYGLPVARLGKCQRRLDGAASTRSFAC